MIKDKFTFSLSNLADAAILSFTLFSWISWLLGATLLWSIVLELPFRWRWKNIYKIWNRPVNIATIIESESKVIHYDGSEPRIEKGVNLDF